MDPTRWYRVEVVCAGRAGEGLVVFGVTTRAELVKKWLGKLTRLNPASGRAVPGK